jgi:hypothetical protein
MPKTHRKTQTERNKEFLALPAKEQRLAIVNDAIDQVLLNRYNVTLGRYFEIEVTPRVNKTTDLQKLLTGAHPVACSVCARGAVFASAVRLSNGVETSEGSLKRYGLLRPARRVFGRGTDVFCRKEEEAFDNRQLRLIECAFEMTSSHRDQGRSCEGLGSGISIDEAFIAVDFGVHYNSEEERMLAILQNIINHDGLFAPEDLVSYDALPTVETRKLGKKKHV